MPHPRWITFALTAPLFLGACGGSADDDCTPAVFAAKIFTRDKGTAQLSGRVSFPSGTAGGRGFQIFAEEIAGIRLGSVPNNIFAAPRTCGRGMDFRLDNLSPGTYRISASVQSPEDSSKVEYAGYYPGTVAAPVTSAAGARAVTVGADNISGIDFGVAKK
jgi:hypothetical protein